MFRRAHLTVSCVLVLAGCADGSPGLVVRNVVAPDDQCTYAEGNPSLAGGVYDLSSGSGYSAQLVLLNQSIDLSNAGTTGAPVANPNLILPREAEIELQDAGGAPVALAGAPNPFRVPVGGQAVPSSDGTTPGLALVSLELIPLSVADFLTGFADTLVVSFSVTGETAGGVEVRSPDFIYPIQICTGCLVRECPLLMEGETEDMADTYQCDPACNLGQDEPGCRLPANGICG